MWFTSMRVGFMPQCWQRHWAFRFAALRATVHTWLCSNARWHPVLHQDRCRPVNAVLHQ